MPTTVLRTNAIPIYFFLSYIMAQRKDSPATPRPKILDCGCGGPVPPLSVFHEQGFETFGLDVSEEYLESSREFCKSAGYAIDLRQGDMRAMPFPDNTFDYVYEHYAMCHLTKKDTRKAIAEMHRVLKPSGLCFLGFISDATWPLSGVENTDGEFWSHKGHEVHSVFGRDESDRLLAGWEIIQRQERAIWSLDYWGELTLEDWMDMKAPFEDDKAKAEWEALYAKRLDAHYTHRYYLLNKPA